MNYFKLLFLCIFISIPAEAKIIDLLKDSEETVSYSPREDREVRRDYDLRSFQHAFNNSSVSDNVSEFNWQPNKIYKVNMRMHMKTLIYLPEDEEIKAYTIGDDFSFKVNILGYQFKNLLDVQSVYAGVDTNLSIIGKSGRVYSFYLRSYPVKSRTLPDFTVYVKAPKLDPNLGIQFASDYERDGSKKSKKRRVFERLKKDNDYLKEVDDPDEINIDYKILGDEEIAPYAVYDDGNWTYFDFRNEHFNSDRLPVVYKVVDGFDSVINTRIDNGFLIAESISSDGWTLKNGDKTICIRVKKSWFKKKERNRS